MNWKELWPFRHLLGNDGTSPAALALYSAAVLQARRPEFYTEFAVADTLDGRFDMITLHVYLVLRRLRAEGAASRPLSQVLADLMFDDMDQSLRELGVGDMGVGKRVRRMAEAFYGRVAAYDLAMQGAMSGEAGAVESALARNVYRGAPPEAALLERLAGYVRRQAAALEAQAYADLAAGRVVFAEP